MGTSTTSRSSTRAVLACRIENEPFVLPKMSFISNSSSESRGYQADVPVHKIDRRVRFDAICDSSLRERIAVKVIFSIEIIDFGTIGINLSAVCIEKKSSVVVKGDGRRDSFGSCGSSTNRHQRCQSWKKGCEPHNVCEE
jgi:hypothetical protein